MGAELPPSVEPVELFLDDRGSLLRARWDATSGRVQLSVWRDGRCVATHSLDAADSARLSSLLTQSLLDSLQPSVSGETS